ncbi:MAG: MarC family protein [Rhodospirillales bacterium]|nr:MarC family protein [Rhodospirillales bacterium]
MREIALVAFTTYFATIAPLDIAAVFAALTHRTTPSQRISMAFKGTVIGACVLLFFAFFGEAVLRNFGISLPALRTAGGILLLLMAIDMVFARQSGGMTTTDEENQEALGKQDVSVFPIATPLIAGPGSIGATILLIANAKGDQTHIFTIIAAMLSVVTLAFLLMMVATHVHKLLGVTGLQVISRVVGVLLAALAMQFIFDGISASGIFS